MAAIIYQIFIVGECNEVTLWTVMVKFQRALFVASILGEIIYSRVWVKHGQLNFSFKLLIQPN